MEKCEPEGRRVGFGPVGELAALLLVLHVVAVEGRELVGEEKMLPPFGPALAGEDALLPG